MNRRGGGPSAALAALFLVALVGAGALLLPRLAGDGAETSTTTSSPSMGLDVEIPTAPASSAPLTTATTSAPGQDEGPPVVLRGDGLGAVRFGAGVDEVVAALTLRWGPPDADSGWVGAQNSPFGVCPGNQVRAVDWRTFSVRFSDGPTPWGPAGRRHFFTWSYRADGDYDNPRPDAGGNRPPLQTEAGVSVGATVAGLQRAYGERLELFDEPEAGGPFFGVQTPNGGINGGVTSVDLAGVVRYIVGGGGCGE
jgi:hypothetical protein